MGSGPVQQPMATHPYAAHSHRPPNSLIKNAVMYYMGPTSIKKRITIIVTSLAAAGVVVALLVLLVGLFRQPAKYRELQTVSVSETNSTNDGTYSVELPKEFVLDNKEADSLSYVHIASDKPGSELIGRVSATAIFTGESNMASIKAELVNQTMQQQGAFYEGYVLDQIKAVMSDLEGVPTAAGFTESTIGNKSALVSDFTYKKQDNSEYSGRIQIVFGAKNLYLLTAVSNSSLWKSNTTVWSQVFQSFVVDTGQ